MVVSHGIFGVPNGIQNTNYIYKIIKKRKFPLNWWKVKKVKLSWRKNWIASVFRTNFFVWMKTSLYEESMGLNFVTAALKIRFSKKSL